MKVFKCTEQSNNWAASNFEEWQRDYNRRNPGSEIHRDILGSMDCQELDEVLSTFIVETRKEKGKKYPPRTLYQLLSGLHRYFTQTWAYLSFTQFLLIEALGSLYNGQGDYTLLGCFIHSKITV